MLVDFISFHREGGAAFQSCVRNLRDLLASLHKSHPLLAKLPAPVRGMVDAFDAELFCAHAQDYCERRSRYGAWLYL